MASDTSEGLTVGVRTALGETSTALRAVSANRAVRRVLIAFTASLLGDAAFAIALTVWAYGVGGAHAVGTWLAVRYVLMAVVAPLGSLVADRAPRKTVMVTSDLVRVALLVAATACLYAGTAPWPIYVLGTLCSLLGSVFRPAQMAWMPDLVTRPEELTASNGVASTAESLSFFIGPAIGALLLAVSDVETVFLANAATFVLSAVLIAGVTPAGAAPVDADEPGHERDQGPEEHSLWSELLAGFRAIAADRDILMVTTLVSLQTVVSGALMVFNVVIAVDILATSPRGVGYLEAVLGVGAIIGGIYAISRSRRQRLATDLGYGVLLWSLPLLLVAVFPAAVAAFATMVLIGFANALVDVNYATILQRITPNRVLGRVFGAVEGALIATMALGALAAPYLIDGLGLRWALSVTAVAVAAAVLPWWGRARRLDGSLSAPDGVALLQSIGIFRPLPTPTVEGLARQLGTQVVAADEVILQQGEASDLFFVIDRGHVQVTQDGRLLREEGPGEFFGEIGLVRDAPRSATVTALEPTALRTLRREAFLAAVTGNADASSALEDVVSRRLAV